VVDSQSNVYVADTWNHRIEKFSSTGALLATWTRQGSLPISIALGPHGTIFVSDQGTNQIVKLSTRGKVLSPIPSALAASKWLSSTDAYTGYAQCCDDPLNPGCSP
jgi:hypothetical protein